MVKILAATLSLLISGFFTRAAAQVKNPETFVYAITGDVDSLDPHWQFDAISAEIAYQVYETLIFYRGSAIDQFDPLLATAVPSHQNGFLSRDGLEYRFPIRKGVTFHDGTPMTPEDVKYSLMRFMLLDRASGSSYLLLEPILGVQTAAGEGGRPDPALWDAADRAVQVQAGAVVVRLKKPYAPLLSILAAWSPIVSKKWSVERGGWDGARETWPAFHNIAKNASPLHDKVNGTGPFKLERWDKENKQVVLSRHAGYWRAPARLKYAVFKTVNEPSARKLMLQTGDADAVMFERQYLPQIQDLPGVVINDELPYLETHNVFVYPFKINAVANPYVGSGKLDGQGVPPDFFADVDVRRGFAFSFDYDAYIRDGYRGKGEPARGPIPRAVFGYNARQATYRRDPARAEEHLKRAHGGKLWANGFRLTATYMEGRADRQLACQILKRNIEALNPKFRVDVRGVQWSTWLAHWSERKIPLANARWHMDYPDPHNAVFPFLHSEGYYAKTQGYASERADRYIELARSEPNRDARRKLYQELQAIAYSDVPQIYTIDTYNFQVLRSSVKGWYYNPIVLYGYLYPVYKEQP